MGMGDNVYKTLHPTTTTINIENNSMKILPVWERNLRIFLRGNGTLSEKFKKLSEF